MDLTRLQTPALLLDKARTIANIKAMILKCNKQNIQLRPHFKTHQSLEVGRWYRELGINKITVSSVKMAEYFASDGWDDILIAFPFNPREIDEINNLGNRIKLGLTVPCIESARLLSEQAIAKLDTMLKIDTGYGRSGVFWEHKDDIIEMVRILESNKNIYVRGLITHSGHTYKAGSPDKVRKIYTDAVKKMNICRDAIKLDNLLISVGDTPSASIIESFLNIDEIRPGNFVFYDLMQYHIGSCSLNDISLIAACPIVDIQNNRRKAVIYGGGVHLSKEYIIYQDKAIYGMAVKLINGGWFPFEKRICLTSLSQEHGVIETDFELPEEFRLGEMIGIIPVHSCLTANLMGAYTLLNGQVIDHISKS